MRTVKAVTALALVAAFAAACTGGAASPSTAATEAPTMAATEAPTAAPTEAPSEAVVTPDPCAPESLALKAAGVMTDGTDNPAYPPYFEKGDGAVTPPRVKRLELFSPARSRSRSSSAASSPDQMHFAFAGQRESLIPRR